MKKLLVIVVILLSFQGKVNGQTSDLYKVYMKSGLIIKAEVIKVYSDSMIQIRQYGLLTNIKMKDVDSVVFDESKWISTTVDRRSERAMRRHLLDSGWSFGFQPGFTIGSVGWDVTSSFTFRGSILRSNLKHLMYGFNFGFDPYLYYEKGFGNISAEGRYYLIEKSTRSPFFYGIGGYGLSLTSPALIEDGGVCASLGFGHAFRTRSGVVFSLMAGYKYQRFLDEQFIWQVGQVKTENRVNRFEFKVEWRF